VRADLVQRLAQTVIEGPADVVPDLVLAPAGSGQEDDRRGRLRALDPFRVVVRDLGATGLTRIAAPFPKLLYGAVSRDRAQRMNVPP
jgi:hypothetical protein